MIAVMSQPFLSLLADIPGATRSFAAGALLFQRDDPVRRVHRVLSGQVHLMRRQADGAAFLLQRAGPGDLVAEASLLSDCYHCDAECLTESVLKSWPLSAVQRLIRQDRHAALAYAAYLAQGLRAARLKAEITSLRRVEDRLDAWLAWNGGTLPEKGGWHHLAGEINVTPEALYREIARRRKAAG